MTIENNNQTHLHEVFSIQATERDNVYILDVDLTDSNGERYRCDYVSDPNDTYGLNPTIRHWLSINEGNFIVAPYAPPTAEDLRATMAPVTARQLRLTLIRNGFSLAAISAAIDALPEGQARDEAHVEWEYATTFERLSVTLLTIASALHLSPEAVDAMWIEALAA